MNLIRLEFHTHTVFSKDSLTAPEKLVAACKRKGIDRVVVTDHNTIRGAQACYALDPERVIVGEEIMTRQGELLAAFVREAVPKGLDCLEAVARLRDQGAFISVSHPFDVTRSGHWALQDLLRIAPLVDAVEIFNSRCLSQAFNVRASDFAEEHGLPGTAGSDAHGVIELGRATQVLPNFHDAASLKESLIQARYDTRLSPPWMRLISRYAVIRKALNVQRAMGDGR